MNDKGWYDNRSRDPENRRQKTCTCGRHSAHDMKKNKHHHSTACRLSVKANRAFVLAGIEVERVDLEGVLDSFESIKMPKPKELTEDRFLFHFQENVLHV